MAKTIENLGLHVAITPYKSGCENDFNVLHVSVYYHKNKGFMVVYQPGWLVGGVWGCIYDFSNDPLTAGGKIMVKAASRNSAKVLQSIYDNIGTLQARRIIRLLFDARAFGALGTAIQYVALNPQWATDDEYQRLKAQYAPKSEQKDNENANINNNSNAETMSKANSNADIIGRVLILGNGSAKYTINGVTATGYNTTFECENMPPMAAPLAFASVKSIIESKNGHWADEDNATVPKAQSTASVKPSVESDVEEVDGSEVDAGLGEPVKAYIVEPTVSEYTADDEPKTRVNTAAKKPAAKAGKVTFATYTTKRGKEGTRIMGFDENDPVYLAGYELHASKTWARKNGVRVFGLLFGPRYKDAAEAMAKAINEGSTLDECREIIEGNTEALAKRRAEQKAEYLQKKAEREAEKADNAKATAKATAKPAKTNANGEKLYTEAEVKERIRKAFTILATAAKMDIKQFEPIIKAA